MSIWMLRTVNLRFCRAIRLRALLRMIAGLETVIGGVAIDGTDVTHTDPADRGVAMVFSPMRCIRI